MCVYTLTCDQHLRQIYICKYIIHTYMCAPDLLHSLVVVWCFVVPLDCALLCRLNI